jgi:hypothetical protein
MLNAPVQHKHIPCDGAVEVERYEAADTATQQAGQLLEGTVAQLKRQ